MRGGRIRIYHLIFSLLVSIGCMPFVYSKINNTSSSSLEIPPIVLKSHPASYTNNANASPSSSFSMAHFPSMASITSETIKLTGHQTLAALLQGRSGIQVRNISGDNSKAIISMRGFGDNAANNSLILSNGLPLRNPDISAPDLNIIPLSEIERIDIFPGSQSVLYGDQAVGGWINLITKSPQKKEHKATIAYGSYETKIGRLMVGDKWNNGLGYRINASSFNTNNYRDHNHDQINRGNILAEYQFSSGTASLNYQKTNQHLQLPGTLTLAQEEQDRRQAQDQVAFNNQDTDRMELKLKNTWASRWTLDVGASSEYMSGIGAYLFAGNPTNFDEWRNANVISPSITGNIPLWHRNITSILGVEYDEGRYDINTTTTRQTEYAWYGQVKIPLIYAFTGSAGVRYAKTEDRETNMPLSTDDVTVSNLELSWEINPHSSWFIRRAGSYRFPKAEENAWVLEGQPLKTQTGVSYETGLSINHGQLSTSLTGYYLHLRNEIICIPSVTAKYFVYNQNLNPTSRIGIIWDASYTINSSIDIAANYHFVHAKFSEGPYRGYDIPFVAQNTARLAATYHFNHRWKIFAEGIWTSRQYPINDVENRTPEIPGYGILNFHMSYEQTHFSIDWQIDNITNRYYDNYRVVTYQGTATNTFYYPAAGIATWISATVTV